MSGDGPPQPNPQVVTDATVMHLSAGTVLQMMDEVQRSAFAAVAGERDSFLGVLKKLQDQAKQRDELLVQILQAQHSGNDGAPFVPDPLRKLRETDPEFPRFDARNDVCWWRWKTERSRGRCLMRQL